MVFQLMSTQKISLFVFSLVILNNCLRIRKIGDISTFYVLVQSVVDIYRLFHSSL